MVRGSYGFTVSKKEREINIKFLSTVSGAAPIEFYPSVQNLLVITDTVSATTYIAENKTNKKITVSIVPSVSPGLAADNVKKIQCFCYYKRIKGSI